MALLAELKCTICQADDPPLDDAAIREKLVELPGWLVIDEKGVKKITRIFNFNNYLNVLDFTHKVGLLAEENGHHPTLITEWGKVTVIWWTHKIKGLHENDFIMAAKTDRIISDK
jgi:4a-hydroxytetrahydrobiopterin dehydratase